MLAVVAICKCLHGNYIVYLSARVHARIPNQN